MGMTSATPASYGTREKDALSDIRGERDGPGDLPTYLPELTLVEEMIIARFHVQIMVHRYRGH
jgi:hypothetical protein